MADYIFFGSSSSWLRCCSFVIEFDCGSIQCKLQANVMWIYIIYKKTRPPNNSLKTKTESEKNTLTHSIQLMGNKYVLFICETDYSIKNARREFQVNSDDRREQPHNESAQKQLSKAACFFRGPVKRIRCYWFLTHIHTHRQSNKGRRARTQGTHTRMERTLSWMPAQEYAYVMWYKQKVGKSRCS